MNEIKSLPLFQAAFSVNQLNFWHSHLYFLTSIKRRNCAFNDFKNILQLCRVPFKYPKISFNSYNFKNIRNLALWRAHRMSKYMMSLAGTFPTSVDGVGLVLFYKIINHLNPAYSRSPIPQRQKSSYSTIGKNKWEKGEIHVKLLPKLFVGMGKTWLWNSRIRSVNVFMKQLQKQHLPTF